MSTKPVGSNKGILGGLFKQSGRKEEKSIRDSFWRRASVRESGVAPGIRHER